MEYLQQAYTDLYMAPKLDQDRGYLYYVLPQSQKPKAPTSLDLNTALTSGELHGTFVFTLIDPGLNADNVAAFVASINSLVAKSRAIIWLTDPGNINPNTIFQMAINGNGSVINSEFDAPMTDNSTLVVPHSMKIDLPNGRSILQMDGSRNNKPLHISGSSHLITTNARTATLPFSGLGRGSIIFEANTEPQISSHCMGFVFSSPGPTPSAPPLTEWLPLVAATHTPEMIVGRMAVYPGSLKSLSSLGGSSIVLELLGSNTDGTPLCFASTYRSTDGKRILLWPLGHDAAQPGQIPASLVLEQSPPDANGQRDFYFAPSGDFMLEVDGLMPPGRRGDLMGGLEGTEYFTFQSAIEGKNGDWLRFVSGQPAYAPTWPFPVASPIGPTPTLDPHLLNSTYTTAWISLIAASGNPPIGYIAQSVGSPQFGQDALISANFSTLYGNIAPAISLNAAAIFPLVPYTEVQPGDGIAQFNAAQVQDFEREIISSTRRRAIRTDSPPLPALGHPQKAVHRSAAGDLNTADTSYNSVTSAGVIVTFTAQGNASKILLAQNLNPTLRQLSFNEPNPTLQQAFQTNDLFLVVANATQLGALAGGGAPAGSAFFNRINIEEWLFEAAVGRDQEYGSYRNVMIVKGTRGKLLDLVASPGKWTMAGTFAAPTTDGATAPDLNQLVPLSYWLQTFFHEAAENPNSAYYRRLNEIADDENWTGILFLHVNVIDVPKDLIGLLAGLSDPAALSVHHLGIEISPVKNVNGQPTLDGPSSMFGLVTYRDPAAGHADEPRPVTPLIGQTYDFRVIDLKVLLRNTAVSDFSSTAQLTLNELFGSKVNNLAHLNNLDNPDNAVVTLAAAISAYNSVLLSGKYQRKQGKSVYTLESAPRSNFYLENEILRKVEVSSTTLTERNTNDPGKKVYLFSFSGALDFNVIGSGAANALDVFSFGNEPGQDVPGKGLRFTGLVLQMSFPLSDPRQVEFSFSSSAMRFDMATSTARAGSLYANFPLGTPTFFSGGANTAPKSLGYLSVDTDFRATGVDQHDWYGLIFPLDLGAAGALAGNVGLSAQLLAAWSPKWVRVEGSYPIEVGLALPGTGGGANMISLQNVLSLSLGRRRLVNAPIAGQTNQRGYLLTLDEMALRFMGLAKLPPNGSAMLYLFGNPTTGNDSSGLGWYAMYGKDR